MFQPVQLKLGTYIIWNLGNVQVRTFDIGILRYCIDIERQKITFDIEIRYYTRYHDGMF
jgi:hypothetical protein